MSTVPGLLGTQEAIRQSQSKDKREEHRARRSNFIAHCIKPSLRAREINDRPLVLRNGRIFVDSGAQDDDEVVMACGYYLPYPDRAYEGLVTKTSKHVSMMNWMYIDAITYRLCYGVRKDADENITGPFDCTSHSRRVTLYKWEGWCAVEEQPGQWAVYFDVEDNGLKEKVLPGTRVLEIELERREERYKKESCDIAQTKGSGISQEEKKDETEYQPPMISARPEAHSSSYKKPEVVRPFVESFQKSPTIPPNSTTFPSYPSKTPTQSIRPTMLNRSKDSYRNQVPTATPSQRPSSRPRNTNAISDRPDRDNSQPSRPPFRIGPLPFESRTHSTAQSYKSSNRVQQSSNFASSLFVPRPRFQSLDIARKDLGHQPRLSTDSTTRKIWWGRKGTEAFPSPEENKQLPKKKLSLRDRASKALRRSPVKKQSSTDSK